VITDGFLGSGGDDTGFWFAGSDFYFQVGSFFALNGEPIVACDPCTPGTQLNLSATMTSGWSTGAANLNGPTHPMADDEGAWTEVYYSGSLTFIAGSVVIPDVPAQPAGLEETVPVHRFSTFTFSGTLTGYADPSLSGTPLFSTQLTGSGSGPFAVTAAFGNLGSGVFLDSVDYHFDDAAPTPEPGSLLLFGSCAAWGAARWRKRRQGEDSARDN
jgi:hypothetical protein